MQKNVYLYLALLLLTLSFIGCSDDDKESARVGVAAAGITHNADQCPKVSGLYSRKEGITYGVMGFAITDNGKKLRLANSSTGLDGHTFIIDGQSHEEEENGQPLKYVAGCDNGVLHLVGSIGNGAEKLDLQISEKEGGVVEVRSGDAQGEYEKVVGQ